MAAIDYLRNHGFDAKVKGNRLVVSPASKLTPADRQYIKLHRLELLAEIGPPFQKKQAVNDPLNSEQIGWLSAVAKLLEVGTMHLLESGFIDRHDLEEQLGADPEKVAALIRSNPFWHLRANDETRRHK